ncbi:MAG: hypothetical protein FJ278_15000, partial [Planctomycetes bacterium]|nr:hypothetical protein [Planctomycetota bacterium]
ALAQVVLEWQEALRRDRNHPAIIGWCPLNETGISDDIARAQHLLAVTQMIDPTRPFLDTSGYCHQYPGTDVFDSHNYNQNPETFRAQFATFDLAGVLPYQNRPGAENAYAGQPYFVSEYGGTKLKGTAQGASAWGYGTEAQDVDDFLKRYKGLTDVLLGNPNMFGFCYTQLTDIEQEQNGVYFYDRRPKYDPARLKAINAQPAAYETQAPRVRAVEQTTILETSRKRPQLWRYTLEKPPDRWHAADFDDSSWPQAQGGFGTEKTPGAVVRTVWSTADIWLRREFDVQAGPADRVFMLIHHDEDAEVFINGKQVAGVKGYTTNYVMMDATAPIRAALRPGRNLIAVHCHQTAGGQYIDVGLEAVRIVRRNGE